MHSKLKDDLIHLTGTQQRMLLIAINFNEIALTMFVMKAGPQSETSIPIRRSHSEDRMVGPVAAGSSRRCKCGGVLIQVNML